MKGNRKTELYDNVLYHNSSDKISDLKNIFHALDSLDFWTYQKDGSLLSSTSDSEHLFDLMFESLSCKRKVMQHFEKDHRPFIAALPFGMIFFAAEDRYADSEKMIYVIGPAMLDSMTSQQISFGLKHIEDKYPGMYPVEEISERLNHLPVLNSDLIYRYTILLHYILNHEMIVKNDIQTIGSYGPSARREWEQKAKIYPAYQVMCKLMQTVKNGDLNYQEIIKEIPSVISHTNSQGNMRRQRDAVIEFISHCTFFAIEGGAAINDTYALQNRFFEISDNSQNAQELVEAAKNMFIESIQLVHGCRTKFLKSPTVKKCCDYIESHINDKIVIADIAAETGYSHCYISRIFKKETGMTVNDYVIDAKLRWAKKMLTTTEMSIGEIGLQLHFSTRAYFSELFKRKVGVTPYVWREKNKRF